MSYGEIKIDTITFTAGGVDTSIAVSGLVQNPTFTGNITTTGTITADVVIGTTLVSGATVTGTTANFVTVSGTTALGNTARFITVSGTTVTGTQANFIGVSGTTITGAIGRFTNVTGVNIVGTTLVSGDTVTGNIGSFTTLTGGTVNLTSGVFASGTAAAPSVSIGTTDNGLYSPGADQVAISTGGSQRLNIDANGRLNVAANSQGIRFGTQANISAAEGAELILNNLGAQPIAFYTNNSERLRITSDGKVGVGTSSPADMLHISGTVPDIRFTDTTGDEYKIGNNNGVFRVYNQTDAYTPFAITGSGNVGVGTTSPAAPFHIGTIATNTYALFDDGTNARITFNGSTSTAGIYSTTTGFGAYEDLEIRAAATIFKRDGTNESARIDSSGRLLVGTSTSVSVAGLESNQQIFGSAPQLSIVRGSNNASGPLIALAKSRNTAYGSRTIVPDGDFLGTIRFCGDDGADLDSIGAQIAAQVDGTPGANDMPGRLVFSTTADGASSPTERLRITSDGKVGVGTSSPGVILDIRETATDATTAISLFNTDNTNSTSQTARIGLSPDSRGAALTGLEAYKENSDFSTSAARDVSLALNVLLNNAKSEAVRITSAGLVGIGTSSPAKNLHISSSSNTALRIADTGTAPTTFGQTNGGLELVAGNANTTAKYMPGIKFGSTDSAFTTTTPKFGAAITAEASEAYDADTDGGMSLAFWTTPNDPGTGGSLQQRLTILNSGNVGIGTTSPLAAIHVVSTTDGASSETAIISNEGTSANTEARLYLRTRTGSVNTDAYIANIGTAANTSNIVFANERGSNAYQEAMRIDGSGRVGIGTSAPAGKLHVVHSSYQTLKLENTADTVDGAYIELYANSPTPAAQDTLGIISYRGNDSAGNELTYAQIRGVLQDPTDTTESGAISFHTRNSGTFSERVRIDSSGRLLVGTSSSRAIYGISSAIQIEGTGFDTSSLSLICNNNGSQSAYLALGRTRGTAVGGTTTIADGDILGAVSFTGAHNSGLTGASASITGYVDGTPGANDIPGRLVFSTTADGASSPTERMRISSGGIVQALGVYNETTANAANVNVSSLGTIQRSTSSIKYKTQVEDLDTLFSDALLECRPVWYRSTCPSDNPDHSYWGFIAEEVAKIDPRLVHWKTTEPVVQENGSIENVPCEPEPEGVAYDRFVPHLLNLIKRQKEQIAAMEARLSALESA